MDSLLPFFEHFTYVAVFFGLLACGLGLPIPEEFFLIGSGLLVYGGYADYYLVTTTAMISIMLGDSIAFFAGKYWGEKVYKIPLLKKLVGSEKRQSWVQKHFDEHSFKTIFIARFIAGVRAPTFFFAGGHDVSYWRFFFADLLGALISVPTSIWIAWYLGENKEKAKHIVHEFHMWLLAAVGILVIGLVLYFYIKRKKKREMAPETESPQGSLGGSRDI